MTIVQFDLVEHYDRPVGYRILADSIDEIAGDAVRKYQQRCKTQIERSGADMSGVNAELAKAMKRLFEHVMTPQRISRRPYCNRAAENRANWLDDPIKPFSRKVAILCIVCHAERRLLCSSRCILVLAPPIVSENS